MYNSLLYHPYSSVSASSFNCPWAIIHFYTNLKLILSHIIFSPLCHYYSSSSHFPLYVRLKIFCKGFSQRLLILPCLRCIECQIVWKYDKDEKWLLKRKRKTYMFTPLLTACTEYLLSAKQ